MKAHADWKKVGGDWKLTRIYNKVVTIDKQTPPLRERTLPKWAVAFQKAAGLLGKSKAQIVEAFGAPVSADDTRYHYVIESQQRSGKVYDQVAGHMTTISRIQTTELDFALEGGQVADITLNFNTADPDVAVFSTMGQVWVALGPPVLEPATLQMDIVPVTQFWLHQANPRLPDPNLKKFAVYFHFPLTGNVPVEIASSSGVPPMKGTPIFDVNTNGYAITTFVPNPAFSWRSAQVLTIQTRTHPQPVNFNNRDKGKEYPVSP